MYNLSEDYITGFDNPFGTSGTSTTTISPMVNGWVNNEVLFGWALRQSIAFYILHHLCTFVVGFSFEVEGKNARHIDLVTSNSFALYVNKL